MRVSLLLAVILLIAVSVVSSRKYNYNTGVRRLSQIKPACPPRRHNLKLKRGRRNRALGSCSVIRSLRDGNRDTCRHRSLSCCPNRRGEYVCVRVVKLQSRKPFRSFKGSRISFKQGRNQKRPTRRPVKPTGGLFTARRPIKSSRKPIKPTRRPYKPAKRPAKPVQRPVKPVQRPVKPVQRPVKPVQKPVKPTQKPVKATQPVPPPIQYAQPLNDGPAVPQKRNFQCPKPKLIEYCNEKGECNVAEECSGFAVDRRCSGEDDPVCGKGYMCCKDPCHKPTRGQIQLWWCFAESDSSGYELGPPLDILPSPVHDDASVVSPPPEDRCPSAAENCERLQCEGFRLDNNCPLYDETYTVCDEKNPCGPTRKCCPDSCPGAESKLCMIPAGKTEDMYIPPDPPVMLDDAQTGLQCPQQMPGCASYMPPPGVPGAGECQEDEEESVCSSDRMCCQISKQCKEKFCIKPVDMDKKEAGCPKPYLSIPSYVDADKTCTSNRDCKSGETCCAVLAHVEEKYCYKKPSDRSPPF